MKHFLITGGTGYIGKNIVHALADQGHYVHLLVRKESDISDLCSLKEHIMFHIYDNDFASIEKIFAAHKFEAVFHLAAFMSVPKTALSLDALIDANLRLGMYLLEAMALYASSYFVNTSTYWQYSSTNNYSPNSLYAASKQAFEDVITYYSYAKKISAISLILYDVYGPNDLRKKIFTLIREAHRDNVALAMTKGEQKMSMVHVKDVVKGYLHAYDLVKNEAHLYQHKKYFLRSQKLITLKKMVGLYQKAASISVEIQWGALPYATSQIMKPYLGKILPGWHADIPFSEGLLDLIAS